MGRWRGGGEWALHLQRCAGRDRQSGDKAAIDAREIVTIPFADGKVMTTIAREHCDGGAETTAIGPVGDQGRAAAGAAGDAVEARGRDGLGEGRRPP